MLKAKVSLREVGYAVVIIINIPEKNYKVYFDYHSNDLRNIRRCVKKIINKQEIKFKDTIKYNTEFKRVIEVKYDDDYIEVRN